MGPIEYVAQDMVHTKPECDIRKKQENIRPKEEQIHKNIEEVIGTNRNKKRGVQYTLGANRWSHDVVGRGSQ